MEGKISIACLPVAGKENPYQDLMIGGLNSDPDIHAFSGVDNRFLGILKTYWKFKPDYIHFDWITNYYERRKLWMTYAFLPWFYFQILFLVFFTKAKIVWTLHNILPHNVQNKRLHIAVRHFFGKHCEWIRVFSEDTVDKAKATLHLSAHKFKILPEGDYTAIYPDQIDPSDARKELGIERSKIVLLWLGFIKPYKGLENLLKVFSKMENREAVLIIAGKSIYPEYTLFLKDLLKSLSEKRVRLLDEFVPVEKLQIFFNAADAVVLPFEDIDNSGSLILSMGFKKPVLAPKLGVVTKRLRDQPLLLYDDLFEGMKTLLGLDKSRLQEIGKNNFRNLKKHKWEDFSIAFK